MAEARIYTRKVWHCSECPNYARINSMSVCTATMQWDDGKVSAMETGTQAIGTPEWCPLPVEEGKG